MRSCSRWANPANSHPSETNEIMPGSHLTHNRDADLHSVGNTPCSSKDDSTSLAVVQTNPNELVLPQACECQNEDVENITRGNDHQTPTSYTSCTLELGQLWQSLFPLSSLTAIQNFQEVDVSLSVIGYPRLGGHVRDIAGGLRVRLKVNRLCNHLALSKGFVTGIMGSGFTAAKVEQDFKPLGSRCSMASLAARSITPRPDLTVDEVVCPYDSLIEDHAHEPKAGSNRFPFRKMVPRGTEPQLALFLTSATTISYNGCPVHRDHHSIPQTIDANYYIGFFLEANPILGVFYDLFLQDRASGDNVFSENNRKISKTPRLAKATDKQDLNENNLGSVLGPFIIGDFNSAQEDLKTAELEDRNLNPQVAADDAAVTEAEKGCPKVEAALSVVNRCNEDLNPKIAFDQKIHMHTDCHLHNDKDEKTTTDQETTESDKDIKAKCNVSKQDRDTYSFVPTYFEEMVQDFERLTVRKETETQTETQPGIRDISDQRTKQDGETLCLAPTHLEGRTEEFRLLTIRKNLDTQHMSDEKYKRPSAQVIWPAHIASSQNSLSRGSLDLIEESFNGINPRFSPRSTSVSSMDTMSEPSMESLMSSLSNYNAEDKSTPGSITRSSRIISLSTTQEGCPGGDNAVSQELDQEMSQHMTTSNVMTTIDQEAIPHATGDSHSVKTSATNTNGRSSFINSYERLLMPSKVTTTTLLPTRGSVPVSGTVPADIRTYTDQTTPTICSPGFSKVEHTRPDLMYQKEDIFTSHSLAEHFQQWPSAAQVQPRDTAQCGEAYNETSRTSLSTIRVNFEDMDIEPSDPVSQPKSHIMTRGNDLVDIDLDGINLEGLDPFGEPIDEDMECEDNTSDHSSSHKLNEKAHEDDHHMLDSGEVPGREDPNSSPSANGATTRSKSASIERHSGDQDMEDINHEALSKATGDGSKDKNMNHNNPEIIGTIVKAKLDDHNISDLDFLVSTISQNDDMDIDNASSVGDLASNFNDFTSKMPSYISTTSESEVIVQFQKTDDHTALVDQNIQQVFHDTPLPVSSLNFRSPINTSFQFDRLNGEVQSVSESGKKALSSDFGHTTVDSNLATESLPFISNCNRNSPQQNHTPRFRHNSDHKATKQKKKNRHSTTSNDFAVPFAAAADAMDQTHTSSTIHEDLNKAVEALSLSPEVSELADEIAEMFDAEATAKEKTRIEYQAWTQAQVALDKIKTLENPGFNRITNAKDDASQFTTEEGAPTPSELSGRSCEQKSPEPVTESKSYDDSVQTGLALSQSEVVSSGVQTSKSCVNTQSQNIVQKQIVIASPTPCDSSSGSSDGSPKAGKRKYTIEDEEELEELPEPVCEEKLKKHRVSEVNGGANPILKGGISYEDVINAIPPRYKFSRIDVDMVIYLT